MADMILVEPIALTIAPTNVLPQTAPTPSLYVNAGTQISNLLTDDPREVWIGLAAGLAASFYIDFGADTQFDTIALLNTNANALADWSITSGTQAQAQYFASGHLPALPMQLPCEDTPIGGRSSFFWAPTPITARYLYFFARQGTGGAPLQVGRLVVGKGWKPALGMEFGSGRPPIDTGTLLSGLSWTFGDLDYDDLKKLWGILRRRRTTEPMLLVEDPSPAVHEGLHWGSFVGLERWERNQITKSRWVLNFEDMVTW
jgi:hypothetical protein